MRRVNRSRRRERGATILEFAISGLVYLTALFAVIDFGRLLWTHNALGDAARLGARHAVSNSITQTTQIKNAVIYGKSTGGSSPIVYGLAPENVEIIYNDIGLGRGTATVKIRGYRFAFATTLFGLSIELPEYQTTLTGETIGFAPPRL